MRANTYFDGPFDQLPDAFVKGETLRNAILDVEPKLKGQTDRFGSEPGGKVRYMIAPYLPYRRIDDLYAYHWCASRRIHSANYYDCFVFDKPIGIGRDRRVDRAGRRRPQDPVAPTRMQDLLHFVSKTEQSPTAPRFVERRCS